MARRTFGPSGKPITVIDSNTQHDIGEAQQPTVIDDNPRTDANFVIVAGDGDGDTGDEVTSDSGPARSQPIKPGYTTYTDPRTGETRQRRKRGTANTPPRSTGASTAANSTAVITANLEKVLFNLHKMGAGLLNAPDFEITRDEAAILGEALKEVAAAYDFTAIFNPRVQAWVDFGIACTVVYGERLSKVMKLKPKIVTIAAAQPPAAPRPHVSPPQPITITEAYRESIQE